MTIYKCLGNLNIHIILLFKTISIYFIKVTNIPFVYLITFFLTRDILNMLVTYKKTYLIRIIYLD